MDYGQRERRGLEEVCSHSTTEEVPLPQGPAVALPSWKLDLCILCVFFSPTHKRKEQMATYRFQNVCIYLFNTQSQGISHYFRSFLSASQLLLFNLLSAPQNLYLFTAIISFAYSLASFFFFLNAFILEILISW